MLNVPQMNFTPQYKGDTMSHSSHEHSEDHTVYTRVGVVFVAVLVTLFFLALIN